MSWLLKSTARICAQSDIRTWIATIIFHWKSDSVFKAQIIMCRRYLLLSSEDFLQPVLTWLPGTKHNWWVTCSGWSARVVEHVEMAREKLLVPLIVTSVIFITSNYFTQNNNIHKQSELLDQEINRRQSQKLISGCNCFRYFNIQMKQDLCVLMIYS